MFVHSNDYTKPQSYDIMYIKCRSVVLLNGTLLRPSYFEFSVAATAFIDRVIS